MNKGPEAGPSLGFSRNGRAREARKRAGKLGHDLMGLWRLFQREVKPQEGPQQGRVVI